MASHYDALGIARSATPDMVKAAFQRKMKTLEEPGLQESARADREKLLREAFVTLFNPASKAKYDAKLAAAAAAVQRAPEPEVAKGNPLVVIAAVIAVLLAVAGGWYVNHAAEQKREQARKDEGARSRPKGNPNPLRNAPDNEVKDRMIKQAIERDAKKK